MKSFVFYFFLVLGLTSCNKDHVDGSQCPETRSGTRFFEFAHESGDLFIAWTDKEDVLAIVDEQLNLPVENRNKHFNGKILENNTTCKLNFEWSWYFDPNDWLLTDLSIELCDGNPTYVEENLDEYVRTGRYCPWGSKVKREIEAPFK